ncbi:hypothetical protein P692DRAFT_20252393 [Suillus brevipes Sb2]|nr:hypothetical protein P692DRAFT_20252393 [Suillus brevipes Sb2]
MASPAHPTRSPTPEQIQDSASLGSSSGAEPPCSPTPTEVLASEWGTSSQRKIPGHGETPRGRPNLLKMNRRRTPP